jgi:hypothetical protein
MKAWIVPQPSARSRGSSPDFNQPEICSGVHPSASTNRWARSYTSTLVDGRTGRGLLGVLRALLKPSTAQTPRGIEWQRPDSGDWLEHDLVRLKHIRRFLK